MHDWFQGQKQSLFSYASRFAPTFSHTNLLQFIYRCVAIHQVRDEQRTLAAIAEPHPPQPFST
ncbi:MAG: hypothetical protein JWR26_2375 [Pedosphaera sp.]|nr:hypothetical protein [Pedosphaera sp.]